MFYGDFGEIEFWRFFDSGKFPSIGKFLPLPARSPPHLDSMTGMMLGGPKNHREVPRKRVSETGGRIKIPRACYLFILEKSIFEKFRPKKILGSGFSVSPFLSLANTRDTLRMWSPRMGIFVKMLVCDNIMRGRRTNQLQLHCKYTHQPVRVDRRCPRRVSRV